jgi:succinate-semialdehyde dehydrogenase / glutarate-semialdehyde dehydrogenase
MIEVDTTKGMFINGEWISSESKLEVFNPATREKITEIPSGGTKEAKQAIESAEAAFEPWAENDQLICIKLIISCLRERKS